MTTFRISCWSCGRRFFPPKSADVTCSEACEAELDRKRTINERARALHNLRFGEPPAREPNRIRYALAETRRIVEQLRLEGRTAARITHTEIQ